MKERRYDNVVLPMGRIGKEGIGCAFGADMMRGRSLVRVQRKRRPCGVEHNSVAARSAAHCRPRGWRASPAVLLVCAEFCIAFRRRRLTSCLATLVVARQVGNLYHTCNHPPAYSLSPPCTPHDGVKRARKAAPFHTLSPPFPRRGQGGPCFVAKRPPPSRGGPFATKKYTHTSPRPPRQPGHGRAAAAQERNARSCARICLTQLLPGGPPLLIPAYG